MATIRDWRRERQIHCVPHRSVNDPQPNPRDVLPVLWLWFPGEKQVVAINRGD